MDFYQAVDIFLFRRFLVSANVASRQKASGIVISPIVARKKFMRTAKFSRQQRRCVGPGFTPDVVT